MCAGQGNGLPGHGSQAIHPPEPRGGAWAGGAAIPSSRCGGASAAVLARRDGEQVCAPRWASPHLAAEGRPEGPCWVACSCTYSFFLGGAACRVGFLLQLEGARGRGARGRRRRPAPFLAREKGRNESRTTRGSPKKRPPFERAKQKRGAPAGAGGLLVQPRTSRRWQRRGLHACRAGPPPGAALGPRVRRGRAGRSACRTRALTGAMCRRLPLLRCWFCHRNAVVANMAGAC